MCEARGRCIIVFARKRSRSAPPRIVREQTQMREDFEGTRVVTVSAEERAAVTARLKRRRTARILCGVLIPVVVLTVFLP